METKPEGVSKSFSASSERLEILRQLTLEFAGVVLQETPSEKPGDFMTHVSLSFTSPEQEHEFMNRMLEIGHQELMRREREEREYY